ncbi:hypothetical protein [Streptomyces sp. SCUT-3]|nr:hypothetical protein [Streptomyces sp. SCUT-3]
MGRSRPGTSPRSAGRQHWSGIVQQLDPAGLPERRSVGQEIASP